MAVDDVLQEIMQYYLSQGMARQMSFGQRPALLVIDFQKGLTDASRPAGRNFDAEINNTLVLLEKARAKDIPVFFFVIGYDQPEVEGGLLVKKLPVLADFIIGSDNTKLDPRLKPGPQEHVMIKRYFSCFFGTPLAAMLNFLQVDTLLIAGCITSGCIRATATDALQHGFLPVIVSECVGDRAPIPHKVNLMDMQARFGEVVPLKQVSEYLDSISQK